MSQINNNEGPPVILILQGPPASGKTTWSKQFCEDNPNWIRISRDDIRKMSGKYWVPSRESLISAYEESLISIALNRNYNVVIDATNLNPETMAKWRRIASIFNAKIETKEFFVPYLEAVKRDKNRDLQVGEDTIRNFYRRYYPDQLKEELNEI